MAEIHDQLAAEGIVKEAFGSKVQSAFPKAMPGRLYLTNERLVFLKSPPLLMIFGAAGAALMLGMKPKKLELEIPRASITGVQRGKSGMNKNVLEVLHSGGEPARFAVGKYDEWEQALGGAGGAGASEAAATSS